MVNTYIFIILGVIGVGAAIAFIAMLRGPDAPTRMVSLDALTLISMPLVVGLAIITQRGILIDVALVYALLSFLGVVTVARYFDKGL